MKAFLTAQWNHLINITYAIDPELLMPHLPKGLSLDLIGGKKGTKENKRRSVKHKYTD